MAHGTSFDIKALAGLLLMRRGPYDVPQTILPDLQRREVPVVNGPACQC